MRSAALVLAVVDLSLAWAAIDRAEPIFLRMRVFLDSILGDEEMRRMREEMNGSYGS